MAFWLQGLRVQGVSVRFQGFEVEGSRIWVGSESLMHGVAGWRMCRL